MSRKLSEIRPLLVDPGSGAKKCFSWLFRDKLAAIPLMECNNVFKLC